MDIPTEKRCSICHQVKPAAEFSRDRSHVDGLRSSCTACRHASLATRKETETPNCVCEVCQTRFYLPPALKRRGGRFCSDACKRTRQVGSEKVCGTCGQMLPLSAFYLQRGGKFGVHVHCKACTRTQWQVAYRKDHPTPQTLVNLGIDPVKGWGFVSVKSLEVRFWEKVDQETCLGETCGCHKQLGHCWPWLGHRNRQGYGRFAWVIGPGKTISRHAHVKAWELVNGPLPPRMIGRHSCDNPCCARPDHVLPGSYRDNSADAISRGRWSHASRNRGTANGNAKYSDDLIALIRSFKGVKPARMLATELGIPLGTILPIWAGHRRNPLD